MKTVLVLFVIFCTHSFGICVKCPEGFLDLEGRCYYFSDEAASWLESASKCSDMGASLLSIETEEEAKVTFHQAVKKNSEKYKSKAVGYWTSGLYAKVSNVKKPEFIWASTWEPFTYTSWCGGEPKLIGRMTNIAST
uniref:C-type lectin domain-containing protein n=1 Tax=Strigamia maritima TaxID=126957 RepID=T1IXI2_STRMM